jgi:putative Mg2+ transporter-C (MgtC) family protein
VHGLTTAACVWVTACVGAACAIAQWQIVVIGVAFVLVILVFGGPFEKAIDRRWPRRPSQVSDQFDAILNSVVMELQPTQGATRTCALPV